MLYRAKDADAIRRIQDRWTCYGFNSVKDRAWPFPYGKPPNGGGSEQCTKTLGRTTACGGAWGEQERRMAGVLVGVAVTVFVIKVRGCVVLLALLKERPRPWKLSTCSGCVAAC